MFFEGFERERDILQVHTSVDITYICAPTSEPCFQSFSTSEDFTIVSRGLRPSDEMREREGRGGGWWGERWWYSSQKALFYTRGFHSEQTVKCVLSNEALVQVSQSLFSALLVRCECSEHVFSLCYFPPFPFILLFCLLPILLGPLSHAAVSTKSDIHKTM